MELIKIRGSKENMFNSSFNLKEITKLVISFVAIIFLSRFSKGYGLYLLMPLAFYFGHRKNIKGLFFLFISICVFKILNPFVYLSLPKAFKSLEYSLLIVEFFLISFGINRNGDRKLPLGGLYIYLFFALMSSIGGYFFLISLLKLIKMTFFVTAIYFGSKNLSRSDYAFVRSMIFAMAIVIIYGSIAMLPFPSIAYYTSMKRVVYQHGLEYADYSFSTDSGGVNLFSGITMHSQTLGPLLALLFVLIISDSLFVEHGLSFFHLFLALPLPVLIYMTRSRTALLTIIVGVYVIIFLALPLFRERYKIKAKVVGIAYSILICLAVFSIIMEIKGGIISSLVRKTASTENDNRSFSEAVTSSRQGLISVCMEDFKTNKLFGIGFQVAKGFKEAYRNGYISIFSAPVEKGLLPLVVLSESGVVGSIVFIFFLISFYSDCRRRRRLVLISLSASFFASNMGEATFFSPGGGGGFLWLVCMMGGFCLDEMSSSEPSYFICNHIKGNVADV